MNRFGPYFLALIIAMVALSPLPATAQEEGPAVHEVASGDTLSAIAAQYNIAMDTLIEVNELDSADDLSLGKQLLIPGPDGELPDPPEEPVPPPASETSETTEATSPSADEAAAPPPALDALPSADPEAVTTRMTRKARRSAPNSPFHDTTWVTYYGRPAVDIMGILGEFEIDEVATRLEEQAAAFDEVNGPELGVTPAFHLVWGMATALPGDRGDFLAYMGEETTRAYIEAAQARGWHVILDIQIGGRTPVEALADGLEWLEYDNVHLALDPEFAMATPGQERPGNPIGHVTAAQVNEAQRAMRDYMVENDIPGRRILIVHQFLFLMIEDKEELEDVYKIDLNITADGWGGPTGKVSKYNAFMEDTWEYTGFKLFYRWDVPLLTERETLGIDFSEAAGEYMRLIPNLVIYQ